MSRTLLVKIFGLVRGVNGPDRPGGDCGEDGVVPRDDGERIQVAGPFLLLHEPCAGVRGDVLGQALAG